VTQAPTDPDGRKLLRLEVRNAQTPIERKPEWIKTRARMGPEYTALQSLVKSEGLHTVCQEAGCPNIFECWEDREATFLIGGDQCTRRCDFCQIDTGKPAELDRDEPRRVAESVAKMGLRYATVTGVARDDLPDGGAWLYAETVRAIHGFIDNVDKSYAGPDGLGKQLSTAIADFDRVAKGLNDTNKQLQLALQDVRPGLRSFSTQTLGDIGNLVGETRQLVTGLSRLSSGIERDPSRILFGDRREGYRPK